MEFIQNDEPVVEKPIIIAAMQDMGNVGSIVINFINRNNFDFLIVQASFL